MAWEPPVDVFEDEHEVHIVVALPGVSPERVEVILEPRSLVVRAERRLPFEDHRLRDPAAGDSVWLFRAAHSRCRETRLEPATGSS